MASLREFARFGKKIVAIGRNYAEHAKELNNAVPTKPFFFLKPTSSYIHAPTPIEIPKGCNVHYELELGVVINKSARDIQAKDAHSLIGGYCLALDMTARNLQEDAKKAGLPWSAAKGFDTFTPVSELVELGDVKDPHKLRLLLEVDGKKVQDGETSDMIFKIPQLIEHVSSIMTLERGDVILTGTPKGVGPVTPGQTLKASLSSNGSDRKLAEFTFPVVGRKGTGAWSNNA
ncbi:hypothetical protein DFS34DRAFT_642835 [Phlyctochytrium arcticum]|nr:hypothetical protein DFS34DRAFT_642835 [Phlyctochytrium arcticum]